MQMPTDIDQLGVLGIGELFHPRKQVSFLGLFHFDHFGSPLLIVT